jgi:DNA-binding HxlR family transcriptional regulator
MEEPTSTPIPRRTGDPPPLEVEAALPEPTRTGDKDIALTREQAAQMLADLERVLARHREEEVTALLDPLRALLEGRGPLAVAYDASTFPTTRTLVPRASFVAMDAQTTLESLAGPIRRRILRRLLVGPCSFTETLKAARLEDTSKIAFHLRKLSESGLIEHAPKKKYRLTRRGEEAIAVLDAIDHLDSDKGAADQVLVAGQKESSASPV